MKLRPVLTGLGAGLLAIAAAAANGATPPQLSPGMTVNDVSGGVVGTIDSVSGGNAVVATGTHKVTLPLTSFAMGQKGPLLGMTKAELDAAADKAQANAKATLLAEIVPGASIKGSQGDVLGTVKALDGDLVVLTTAEGDARVPMSAVTSGPNGLMVGMTVSDFHSAMGGAD